MKLLTKAIAKKLPALYATENTPTEEKVAVCKFFTPDSNWTWFVVEGSAVLPDGENVPLTDPRADDREDVLFFGLVHGHEKEWGYFSLNELESVKGPFGLGIERDTHFDDEPVAKYA